jgi:hypothetical protein
MSSIYLQNFMLIPFFVSVLCPEQEKPIDGRTDRWTELPLYAQPSGSIKMYFQINKCNLISDKDFYFLFIMIVAPLCNHTLHRTKVKHILTLQSHIQSITYTYHNTFSISKLFRKKCCTLGPKQSLFNYKIIIFCYIFSLFLSLLKKQMYKEKQKP